MKIKVKTRKDTEDYMDFQGVKIPLIRLNNSDSSICSVCGVEINYTLGKSGLSNYDCPNGCDNPPETGEC